MSHVCFIALLFSSFITAPFVLCQVLKGSSGQKISHLFASVTDVLHLGKLCSPVTGEIQNYLTSTVLLFCSAFTNSIRNAFFLKLGTL